MIRNDWLNNLGIAKGQINGNRFPLWDSVPLCRKKECPLFEECQYHKDVTKKCKLQVHYLRSALDITLSNLPSKSPSEYTLSKVGLHLLPLYKQLITMKMLEHTLRSPEVGEGGKVKIHPVYKEIRQINKDIDMVLKDLEVNGSIKKDLLPNLPPAAKEHLHGSEGYYEQMQKVHEDKRDKRKNKSKDSRRNL